MRFDLVPINGDDVKIFGARLLVHRNAWGQTAEETVSQSHLEQVQGILRQIVARVDGKEFKDIEIQPALEPPKEKKYQPVRRGRR